MKRVHIIIFGFFAIISSTLADDNYCNEEECIASYRNVTIISLGANCTPALYARLCGVRAAAYPFDWCITSYGAIYHCLKNNFSDYFKKNNLAAATRIDFSHDLLATINAPDIDPLIENTECPWVLDKQLQIIYNHDFSDKKKEIIDQEYAHQQEKYQRRVARFMSTMHSGKKIYLIRYQPHIAKNQVFGLYHLLKAQFPRTNFMLIIIQNDKDNVKKLGNLKKIKQFYCPRDNENTFFRILYDKIARGEL